MHILLVVPEWPPDVIGGGGAVYRRIADWYASNGHSVTVVTGDHTATTPFANVRRENDGGMRIYRVPLVPTPARLAWMRAYFPPLPQSIATLIRVMCAPFDVMHVHGIGVPLVDLACRIARLRKLPYVLTIHGFPATPLQRGAAIASMMRAYIALLTGPSVRGAAALTLVSQAIARQELMTLPPAETIYNGIDGHRIVAGVQPRRGMRLMILGRLYALKGIDIAIRALARVGTDVTLDVYGHDGGDGAMLAALAHELGVADRVRFLGWIDRDTADVALAEHDALLVPSRVEAFGIAALDGLAAGIPLIATRVQGLGEILDPSYALLVPTEDAAALADAIERLRDSAATDARVAAGLRAIERFRWEHILPQYEALLRSAAKNVELR